mgnify:CR=1 FL=1|jgi:hypothetical protein
MPCAPMLPAPKEISSRLWICAQRNLDQRSSVVGVMWCRTAGSLHNWHRLDRFGPMNSRRQGGESGAAHLRVGVAIGYSLNVADHKRVV